jgi:outer membrane lipoprotein SlyB
MRKFILAGAALLTLSTALPAFAQNSDAAAGAGAVAGGTTGGTIGFLLGGPIGAIIGGFSGAVIGGTVSDAAVTYAGNHPVEQVYLDTDLDIGVKVSGDVTLYPIESEDDLSYFYANGRVWIVATSSGEIVASPGYVIPETAVAYVKANPTASIAIEGDVAPGFVLDADVDVVDVPDARGYAYFYVNDRPALIDARSRTVIWVE